jgi:transposase
VCDHGWLNELLPQLAGVVVERIEQTESGVLVWARVGTQDGCCPSCGRQSRRVHGRYDRKLADCPVASQQVVLRLQVRRFFCDAPDCPAATFAEQVAGLTVKYARRTPLCRQALEHVGLALAGRAGSRLASRLGFSTGWNTLLRLVRALPDPEIGAVTVLGIDDFAIARGRRYATVRKPGVQRY